MEILGLAYLGFESPTNKEWLEYGPEVLGLGVADQDDDDGSVYLRMDDRRHRIAVHPGEADRLTYIGWELTSRITFAQAVEKLQSAGVEVEEGNADLVAKRGVKEVARFVDPSGYQHEFCYGQKFHPNSFVPGRPHHGFLAGCGHGIGHVVLHVPDFSAELHRFMLEVLQFRWFGGGAGPVSAGFYGAKLSRLSHNIAYVGTPGLFGINHIGMGVNRLDDVGIAADRVKERGLQVQRTLGRHTQDPVVSFYHFTPSSFAIEYFTEDGEPHALEPWELNPEHLSIWGHELVGPMIPPSVHPAAG